MKASAQVELFPHVSFVDKLLFTKHMTIMLKSGIPIPEALEIFVSQIKSPTFKKVIVKVSHAIQNGSSLAKALGKHPKVFDNFYVNIIAIGENSGTLEGSLQYLSQQLTKDYAFRKKVQGALMYPMIVLIAATIIGIALSVFVLPKLLDLFTHFDAKLPLSTQILIFFSHIILTYGVVILILIIIFSFFFRFSVNLSFIKPSWHQFLLGLPLFGKFIQNVQLTSFCRNMGIMLKSGMPITDAFRIQVAMSSNMVFKKYTQDILFAVEHGRSFSAEVAKKKYKHIPLIATKMITVGETTGNLDETLLYLGDFFEEEVDDATKNIATILEPLLLLAIGIIVAFVAMAVITPIYNLTGSIQQ